MSRGYRCFARTGAGHCDRKALPAGLGPASRVANHSSIGCCLLFQILYLHGVPKVWKRARRAGLHGQFGLRVPIAEAWEIVGVYSIDLQVACRGSTSIGHPTGYAVEAGRA